MSQSPSQIDVSSLNDVNNHIAEHRLLKRQSLSTTTVLFRTTFTRTIKLNLLKWLLGSNLSQCYPVFLTTGASYINQLIWNDPWLSWISNELTYHLKIITNHNTNKPFWVQKLSLLKRGKKQNLSCKKWDLFAWKSLNNFVLSLALKQRQGTTQKRPSLSPSPNSILRNLSLW